MNFPNLLSLSRVAVLPLLALLLGLDGPPTAWLALVVFVLAALTDAVDGWAARKFDKVTTVGKFLDALVDKIFVLGVLVVLLEPAARLSLLPATSVAVVLILTREFGVTGLRILAVKRQVVLAAERGGKIKTALQMGALGLLLLANALLAGDPKGGFGHACYFAGHVVLWLAVIQTVVSGFNYFRRYGYLLREEGTA
ncbi:MAG: CDP-diacylglycerol--glycerol-3-phosphate 3-phosphatidyltransferase [Opitutales bacterium]